MTRVLQVNADPKAPQVPQPGEVLGGKYRIERVIGSGGMGIVYEVTHLVMTKKRFAVKWLLPLPEGYSPEDAQAALRRFTREAEIAGGICHPNVVQVFDVTVSDDGCFMVMELLEGESLEARLKREGPLPVAEACRIITACALGVGAAHAAHVIHRDIKPANIFLTRLSDSEPSCPKVLDFGISRFAPLDGSDQSTVTRAGTLIGTPMYMAPEQLRGFECDARTDVYGLGVTLYEALSGKPAYSAPTHADLVVRIVTGDAQELRQLDPAIPAGLSAIVMRALHHQPEVRFATVQSLMDALKPFTVVGASAPVVAPRARPRRWAVWLTVCAAVLGILALSAVWAMSRVPATQPSAATREVPVLRPKPVEPSAEVAPTSPVLRPAAEPLETGLAPPPEPARPQTSNSQAPHPAAVSTTKPRAAQAQEKRPLPSQPAPRAPKPRPALDGL